MERIDNGQADETMELTADMRAPENNEGTTALSDPVAPIYDTSAPSRAPTPLEAAANEIVDHIALLRDDNPHLDMHLIALADVLETEAARSQAIRIDTPRLLEITGNVEERELAARHMDQKAQAARAHAKRHGADFDNIAQMFLAAAGEFRSGLHLPEIIISGRVVPYNETNDTGVRHESAVNVLVTDVHARNVKAGWWHDLETGEPKDRNAGELIALVHSELSEALEGVRKSQMDDHLPHRKMEEVEMADAVIRIADYCGGRGLDLGGAIDEKLAYNAKRADHKIENRRLDGGKKI